MAIKGSSWIAAEIVKMGGMISGERFMELALYHPGHGYYHNQGAPMGRDGDYVTAPLLTSLFGELLCLQCIEVWEIMGSPSRFVLVEVGPGTGHLAEDMIRTASRFPQFRCSLDYRLVEVAPALRQMQQKRLQLAGLDQGCRWFERLEAACEGGIEGVILGNEFLDALPVRWVVMTAEGLREVGVAVSPEEELCLSTIPVQAGLECDYFVRRLGWELPVGMRTEVGLQAQEWMRLAGRVLRRGLVLMIDYGFPARKYYTPERHEGTLVGHFRHQRVNDPLQHPGAMDLTAHVDFSAMARAGQEVGLEVSGYTSQGWFLMGLGLLERLQSLVHRQQNQGLGKEIRQSALRLVLPEEMGERFKTLALSRGLKNVALTGYRLKNQSDEL
ncbi:MAG: SAM-dependent methyltransferase [Magnetococcales bacterium]|nr:SAM-dependent methyltransferase [Magnetococcales bacterium]